MVQRSFWLGFLAMLSFVSPSLSTPNHDLSTTYPLPFRSFLLPSPLSTHNFLVSFISSFLAFCFGRVMIICFQFRITSLAASLGFSLFYFRHNEWTMFSLDGTGLYVYLYLHHCLLLSCPLFPLRSHVDR